MGGHRRRNRGIVVATIALLLLGSSAIAWATSQASPGLIAFNGYVHGRSVIDEVSAAGGSVTQVASDAFDTPAWSPNGTQLAFARSGPPACNNCNDIYVMNADGTALQQLTTTGTSGVPVWSPTGNAIAFDEGPSVTSDSGAIFTIEPNGTGLRRLGGSGSGLAWSPNGSEIAYQSYSPSGIYVIPATGGKPRRLTKGNDQFPVWSPDSSEIAFTRETPLPNKNDRNDIYVVSPTGSGLRRLTTSSLQGEEPAWDPNGQLIAFVGEPKSRASSCQRAAIYLIAPDGSVKTRITGYEPTYNDPTWSPDGNQIAFTSAHGCLQETQPLYVTDVTNGHPVLLTSSPSPAGGTPLAWQPAATTP
ncbi:MAG: hypothetical protein ABSC56_00645 [Solirubrobacteraceae bacterium]|jgi:TolB protein